MLHATYYATCYNMPLGSSLLSTQLKQGISWDIQHPPYSRRKQLQKHSTVMIIIMITECKSSQDKHHATNQSGDVTTQG